MSSQGFFGWKLAEASCFETQNWNKCGLAHAQGPDFLRRTGVSVKAAWMLGEPHL